MNELTAIMFAVARLSGFFLVIPGLSSRIIPVRIKIFLLLAIGLLVSQLSGIPSFSEFQSKSAPQKLAGLMNEFIIGVLLALPTRIIYSALDVYGAVTSYSIGMTNSFTSELETGAQEPILSNFINLMALSLIFITGLHTYFLTNFFMSYNILTPMFDIGPRVSLVRIVENVAEMFAIGVKLGAPFLIVGLAINVASGVVNRMIQQVPIYFVAMPILLLIGIIVFASVGAAAIFILLSEVRTRGLF